MSTIAVVDVITQYLMIFGLLLGDIKKEFFITPSLDRLFKKTMKSKTLLTQGTRSLMWALKRDQETNKIPLRY